ncbi:Uncharacterised protein [Yersinia wautersii]|uniref:Uncharacterized protein n=1 Tax=Yersinia wautersii TaxID=1341643 RepID=A0ABP1Z8V7_9GAMM|nr:Uncharacterised protein [Yersinia wautersii]
MGGSVPKASVPDLANKADLNDNIFLRRLNIYCAQALVGPLPCVNFTLLVYFD